MATIDLTLETFDSTISDNEIVFVDYWAAWCGPCRMFAPTFEAASEANPEVVFAKVDTEDQQQLAGMAGIQSIPTLMIFKEKVLIFSQPGALPAAALDELIAAAKDLDMVQVHAQIAAEKAAESGAQD
jgi:thioredoxin 1